MRYGIIGSGAIGGYYGGKLAKSGQEVHFSPEARVKAGPYIGWSLLFLGYTIDLAYISANKKNE